MSGPKKAEVQAELGRAQNAARAAESRIAAVEMGVVNAILDRAQQALAVADSASLQLAAAADDLAGCRQEVASAAGALDAVARALNGVEGASAALASAQQQVKSASRADAAARVAFDRAQAEFDRAEAALRRSGGHYLRDQMAWAQEARRGFEAATQLANQAADLREHARRAAAAALSRAQASGPAVRSAVTRASAARRESDERARAEAEARRIAQEAMRAATLAVSRAASSVSGLDKPAAEKFAPGRREALAGRLAEAQAHLRAGNSANAQQAAAGIDAEAARLGVEVARLKAVFEARRAECMAAIGELEAVIQAADPQLIANWADEPGALEAARSGLVQAQAGLDREQFEDASVRARALSAAVAEATTSGAAAHAANERRTSIGEAVMDVLAELGFDVSFEPGGKVDPMRISGQSANVDGRGDFDIRIPLDGEIDFEVTASQGDGGCAGAVASLQERLGERGVRWQTTDWGYGHEPDEPQERRPVRQEVRQQVRSHGAGVQGD